MGLDVQSLSAEGITRAMQLCVWEIARPEPWLDDLVDLRADTVASALMPWFEREIGLTADDAQILRSVDFVLHASHALQRPFLQRAVEMMRDGQVSGKRLQRRLFHALTEVGIPSKELITELASRHLITGANATPPVFALDWFVAWAEVDLAAAWSWLEANQTAITRNASELVGLVEEGLNQTYALWNKGRLGTEAEVTALVSLFRFLSVHADASQPVTDVSTGLSLPSPIHRVRDRIPGILASMPGKTAHSALQELACENRGTVQGVWLQGL